MDFKAVETEIEGSCQIKSVMKNKGSKWDW